MKIFLVTALFLMADVALAKAPKYTLKSRELPGAYEWENGDNYHLEGMDAQIKYNKEGELKIYLGNFEFLIEEIDGQLTFENHIGEDCDYMDCTVIEYISGMITAEKFNGKYVPKITFEVEAMFHDSENDEEDYEGTNVNSTEVFRYKGPIIDVFPLYREVKLDRYLQSVTNKCMAAVQVKRDDLLCMDVRRYRFRDALDTNSAEFERFRQEKLGNDELIPIDNSVFDDVWGSMSKASMTIYNLETQDSEKKAKVVELYTNYVEKISAYMKPKKFESLYFVRDNFFYRDHLARQRFVLINTKYRSVTIFDTNTDW